MQCAAIKVRRSINPGGGVFFVFIDEIAGNYLWVRLLKKGFGFRIQAVKQNVQQH